MHHKQRNHGGVYAGLVAVHQMTELRLRETGQDRVSSLHATTCVSCLTKLETVLLACTEVTHQAPTIHDSLCMSSQTPIGRSAADLESLVWPWMGQLDLPQQGRAAVAVMKRGTRKETQEPSAAVPALLEAGQAGWAC